MKKKIIMIVSMCLLPFLLWGILFINDVIRFGDKPSLIILKKDSYNYIDGSDTQYCSLGYEFIYRDRFHSKGWYFNFGCSKIEQEEIKMKEFIYEGQVYQECKEDYLYETEEKVYYLRCADVDSLYIVINGEKILVKNALQEGKMAIQDFKNSSYTIRVENKMS